MVAPIHLVAVRYPRASQALQGDIAIYADGTYDQGAWKAALETKRAGGHLALSAAPQGGGLSTADEDHVLALTD